mgnify:CR=1 FL=1
MRIATFKEGISISDLKKSDNIYISKIESGFQVIYNCEFEKFSKGIVHAIVLDADRPSQVKVSKNILITARLTNCFLWGKGKADRWERCHWFKKGGSCD